jgi:hypothetical protein
VWSLHQQSRWPPWVSMSSQGHAIVAWTIDEGNSLRVNVAPPNAGWGTATLVKPTNASVGLTSRDAGMFVPVIDGAGNGFAQWTQTAPREDPRVWIRRYEASSWGTATLHQSEPLTGSGHAVLAMNGRGDAVTLYYQGGIIRARTFSAR